MKSGWLERYGVLVAFLVLFAVNVAAQPAVFPKPENLLNLLTQNVAPGLLAVGMTLVILSGGIDLSVGSLMALSAAVGLRVLNQNAPENDTLAVVIGGATAVAIGAGLGAVQGALVALGRLAPFVVTLCGLVMFRSGSLVVGESGEIQSMSQGALAGLWSNGIPLGNGMTLIWGVLVWLGIAAGAHFLVTRMRYGRELVAVGSNEKAAYYAALPITKIKVVCYGIMGALCGLAGLFSMARMNSVASGNLGQLAELDAIAAVVIGGASLSGGKGSVWNTVLGVLILAMIQNLLILSNVNSNWQGLVKGVIILGAVMVQRGFGQRAAPN